MSISAGDDLFTVNNIRFMLILNDQWSRKNIFVNVDEKYVNNPWPIFIIIDMRFPETHFSFTLSIDRY